MHIAIKLKIIDRYKHNFMLIQAHFYYFSLLFRQKHFFCSSTLLWPTAVDFLITLILHEKEWREAYIIILCLYLFLFSLIAHFTKLFLCYGLSVPPMSVFVQLHQLTAHSGKLMNMKINKHFFFCWQFTKKLTKILYFSSSLYRSPVLNFVYIIIC